MAYLAEREGARTQFVSSIVHPISPFHDSRALFDLARLVREFRPHIVHTHTAKAGFLGRAAALSLRPRPIVVHTYHGHVLEGYFGRGRSTVYGTLERSMARVSDCLIGVSDATVDDLVRLGVAARERFRVIRLGLDLAGFAQIDAGAGQALRDEIGVRDGEVLLTFAGRLVPIKRVDRLLRAVSLARAEGARVRLAIVGDGGMRSGLEDLARDLGILKRVHFLGYRRDLARIAAATDVAVVSSENEGTPVSLIEAAAAGCPAIATEVGGVAEVVTPETGILVPPDDEAAFADALGRLAGEHDLRRRMGGRARERVLSRYSIDRLLADVDELYADLISARDGGHRRPSRDAVSP